MANQCPSVRILLTLAAASLGLPMAQAADPVNVFFVGNSFTFGRVDPVMGYNTANVTDLTRPGQAGRPSFDILINANPYQPHPWGGVPGIVKQMTVQKNLDYTISPSTRNAASLRGHFLNISNTWDLQSNLAFQKWDKVVLQDLSDEPLSAGRSGNANRALFNFYANKIQDYLHNGGQAVPDSAAFSLSTTESLLWGAPVSVTNAERSALCRANSGLSQASCNTARTIKGTANENPDAQVYLYQTWARPDMVYAHPNTVTDPVSGAVLPAPGTSTPSYASLEEMIADLHASYFDLAAANPRYRGVAPVGDAFMRAVQDGGPPAIPVRWTRWPTARWTCGGTTSCTPASTGPT